MWHNAINYETDKFQRIAPENRLYKICDMNAHDDTLRVPMSFPKKIMLQIAKYLFICR